jgi:hypothetical protein
MSNAFGIGPILFVDQSVTPIYIRITSSASISRSLTSPSPMSTHAASSSSTPKDAESAEEIQNGAGIGNP